MEWWKLISQEECELSLTEEQRIEKTKRNREIESALTNLALTPYRYFPPVVRPL